MSLQQRELKVRAQINGPKTAKGEFYIQEDSYIPIFLIIFLYIIPKERITTKMED